MFAAVFIALYAGHQVGDHWVQTDGQAQAKEGSALACASHVLSYMATQQVFLTLLIPFGLWVPDWKWWALGTLVNGATHYWADRRKPLRRLAEKLGKGGYWDRGGAYPLDQAWHYGWLFISALIITA